MSYIPTIYGQVDSNNSSTATLTANSVFTGTSTDATNYANLTVYLTTDQSSATNGLSIQFSSDGTNWDSTNANTITVSNPGTSFNFSYPYEILARYYRLVYTNGGTSQGVFRLQSILNAQASNIVSLAGLSTGQTKARIPITSSAQGSLDVRIRESVSAFGDFRTVQPTPVSQFNFVYGINTNYVITTTANSGSVTAANQMAQAATTTSNGSSAIVQSKKFFKYREGLGGLMRFTTVFSTGIANNNQLAGIGDATDGYFFGYNGTSFGILYRKNAVDTWTTQANWNMDTMLGTGTSSNESCVKLDPTKGNVYQIQVSYLGFGNIEFFIYNQYTSSFVMVHNLFYANQNTTPLVTNPVMTLWWQSINTAAAASAITISAASGGIYVDGPITTIGAKYGISSSLTNPGTTERNILTIRNNTTINSITNKSGLQFLKLSFGAIDSTTANNANSFIVNLRLNATVAGTPSFTNISATNSLAAYDTAGTTISAGGTIVASYAGNFSSSIFVDMIDDNIVIYPGDTMVFSILLSASSANLKTAIAVNWEEET